MISVRIQGKPFSITIIEVYAPTTHTEEVEVEQFRQESLRRNGVAIMVNKRVQNAVLGCNLKNDRMISVSKANH